jgi:hypothetical protein
MGKLCEAWKSAPLQAAELSSGEFSTGCVAENCKEFVVRDRQQIALAFGN